MNFYRFFESLQIDETVTGKYPRLYE